MGQKELKKGKEVDERRGSQGVVGRAKPGLGKGQDVKDGTADAEDNHGETCGAKDEVLEGWVTIDDAAAHWPKKSVTQSATIVGGPFRAD